MNRPLHLQGAGEEKKFVKSLQKRSCCEGKDIYQEYNGIMARGTNRRSSYGRCLTAGKQTAKNRPILPLIKDLDRLRYSMIPIAGFRKKIASWEKWPFEMSTRNEATHNHPFSFRKEPAGSRAYKLQSKKKEPLCWRGAAYFFHSKLGRGGRFGQHSAEFRGRERREEVP